MLSEDYVKKLSAILRGCSNLYVLDLSWHLHRSMYTFKNMYADVNGYHRPTGHIYGVFNAIRSIKHIDPEACIVITEDGVPLERIETMTGGEGGYKEGRPELEFNFYQDIPTIKAICCAIPKVYWAYNEDKECDDEMYALSRHAQNVEGFTGKTFVYSGDNDLLQSIDDRTSVVRTIENFKFIEIDNKVVQTDEKFTKKFHGVDTKHIVNFRAICGDASDKIKGVPRFPRDIAYQIAMSSDNITEGCNWVPTAGREEKYYQLFLDNRDLVNRNYKLMKLSEDYDVKLSKPVVKKEKLMEKLNQLQLRSVIRYMEELR